MSELLGGRCSHRARSNSCATWSAPALRQAAASAGARRWWVVSVQQAIANMASWPAAQRCCCTAWWPLSRGEAASQYAAKRSPNASAAPTLVSRKCCLRAMCIRSGTRDAAASPETASSHIRACIFVYVPELMPGTHAHCRHRKAVLSRSSCWCEQWHREREQGTSAAWTWWSTAPRAGVAPLWCRL